jgi:hypothetical protein
MYQYRVTKYDPAYRNAAGAYTRQDWTSFRHVGRSFDGVPLTREEYLRVESAYIESAVAFLTEDQAPELRVTALENQQGCPAAPTEGATVKREDFPSLCRSVLREEFWCRLEAEGRFVHFGWDYYMYVGVLGPCEKAVMTAQALGLFVEECDSPHHPEDEENG